MTTTDEATRRVKAQLVLGCEAIHAQHGFQFDAAHDCHAPEVERDFDSLIERLHQAEERAEKAEQDRDQLLDVQSRNMLVTKGEYAELQSFRQKLRAAEERAEKAETHAWDFESGEAYYRIKRELTELQAKYCMLVEVAKTVRVLLRLTLDQAWYPSYGDWERPVNDLLRDIDQALTDTQQEET